MNKLKSRLDEGNTLKLPELTLKFCGKGVSPPEPSASLLPVLMYSCPDSFSTVAYFDVSKLAFALICRFKFQYLYHIKCFIRIECFFIYVSKCYNKKIDIKDRVYFCCSRYYLWSFKLVL